MEHVHDAPLVAAADGGGADTQVQSVEGARESHQQIRLVLAGDPDDGAIRILLVVELDQQRLYQDYLSKSKSKHQEKDNEQTHPQHPKRCRMLHEQKTVTKLRR